MVRVSAVAHGRIRGACAFSLALAAAAVATGVQSSPAAARGYAIRLDDEPPRSEAARDNAPRSRSEAQGRRRAKPAGASAVKRAEPASPDRPLFMVISIADQRVSVYNRHGLVDRSVISTGVPGHPTPKGVFTIIGRERYHRSNIYAGAPMPFMQRITWSGIAMHLGVVPGRPASHGCIRLPAGFAAKLWGLTRIGERVVISPHDVAPATFAHPSLPSPKMQVVADADGASPAPVDPRRYAERLKAAAAVEAAAAAKTKGEAFAAVGVRRQEAARARAELQAAEAAHASTRAKAEAATRVYDAAADAAEAAKQREAVRVAELAAEGRNVAGEAEAGRTASHAEASSARDAAAAAKASAEAALAEAATRLEAAKAASAGKTAELTDALRRASEAATASDAAAKAEKAAQLRTAPLSVLVSKKDKRIYVRQGLTPIFDAPANVRDPDTPLGSHLYIATAAGDDGASLEWSVVSMPARVAEARSERRGRAALIEERTAAAPRTHGFASSAADALERIEIDQEVRDRIAERLWTGASIIISDQPLSGETGAVGTDLTVKLR